MDAVRVQLIGPDRRGLVAKWYDRMVTPGQEWKREIDGHIRTADVILLFISAHFIASDYCYETEMQVAMDRHRAGNAVVIPILLSPCLWEEEPVAQLQLLPSGARPLNTWPNLAEGTDNVARGIMHVVRELMANEPDAVSGAG